jgi:rhodanese-related sulfurtransferase
MKEGSMDRTVTTDKVAAMLKDPAQVTLLDVRRTADVDADPVSIPGAVWRDPNKVNEWVGEIPKDRPLVLYCVRGGSVSTAVLDKLLEKGVTAQYLEGGLAAWKAGGNKTVQH